MDISQFVDVLTINKVQNEIREKFILRRKEAKISQKKLSEISHVSYGSIRRFEQMGEISLFSLLRLTDAIGLLKDFQKLFNDEIIANLREYK